MRYLVKVQLVAFAVLTMLTSLAFGATVQVIPNQLPKGAYVNGTDGDQHFIQTVEVTFDAAGGTAWATGNLVTITLPTGVTIAQVDPANSYANHVYRYFTTGAANITATAVAATAGSITLTLTVAGANITANDILRVTFPVETEDTLSGSANYTVSYSPGRELAGDQTLASVTYEDTLVITGFTFQGDYSGNDDQSSALGALYPTAGAVNIVQLGNLIIDDLGGTEAAVYDWATITLNGVDDDAVEPTYQLWASQTPSLKKVDTQQGHIPLDELSVVIPAALEVDASFINDQLNGALLAEDYWFFYLTSDVSGDWVIASSDSVNIRHWPAFNVTNGPAYGGGVNYDQDAIWEPGDGNNDDLTATTGDLYLESGGTLDMTGGLGGTNSQVMDFYWDFEDLDDNATIQIFIAADPNYDETDLILAGTDGNETVTGLGTGTEITTAPIAEESAVEYFTYDIYTDAVTYETAGTYTVYFVTNDSTNQQVLKVCGDDDGIGGCANDLALYVKHFPYLKFEDPYTSGVGGTASINTDQEQYLAVNWGGTVDGDKDADGNATINLYLSTEDLAAVFIATASADATDQLNSDYLASNHTLIQTTTEDPDDPDDNYYMYDIRNAGLTQATSYYIIGHIAEGGDNLVVEYNSTGTPTNAPSGDIDVQVVHGAYFAAETPVEGEIVDVTSDDEIVFDWLAFDLNDADADEFDILAVPDGIGGITGLGLADNLYNTVTGGAGAATTADFYWITGANGSAPGALGTLTGGAFTLDVSDLSDDIGNAGGAPNGYYEMYYYYTFNAAGLAGVNPAPVQAPGLVRFLGGAPTGVNFEVSPTKAVLSKNDIVTITVRAESQLTTDKQMLAISIQIPSTYLDPVDQGGGAPFIDEVANFDGAVLENSVTTAGGYHYLSLIETAPTAGKTLQGAGLVTVATFQVEATTSSSGTEFVDNNMEFLNNATYATMIMDVNGAIENGDFRSPAGVLHSATPGIIYGEVDMEARTDESETVGFYLSPRGSYVPITDSEYLTANGGANANGGVDLDLGADGSYTLTSVPTGDYDLIVQKDSYLISRVQGLRVTALGKTEQNFTGAAVLLGGDVAGYDHDGDATNFDRPDNQIDGTDITAVSDAFDAYTGETDYNPLTDIDADGHVYIVDYNLVIANQGNSAGLLYKQSPQAPANENLIAQLVKIDDVADVNTYAVRISELSSLHGYAVRLAINTEDWEIASFDDRLSAFDQAVSLSKVRGHEAVFASAILGHNLVTDSEMDLMILSLRSRVASPEEPSITEVSVVDGRSEMVKAIITGNGTATPAEFSLSQNFPNPFNPVTTINFALPEAGKVRLAVYNLLGQEVRTLAAGSMVAGNYKATWNSLDNMGRKVSSGIYLYRLTVDNNIIATKKMVLLQ